MKPFAVVTALAATCFVSPQAGAQVTTGSTDVTDPVPLKPTLREKAVENTTELSVQGGGLTAGGNAQTAAGTTSSRFFKRMGQHEVTNLNAINYARSSVDDGPLETTVENYQARLRYEYFLSNQVSVFLSMQARRDTFQALNLRLGIDPGVAYHFVRNQATKFWLEGGYDLQYEDRTQETVDLSISEGTPIDKTRVDHNARFFLGYDQRMGDRLQLVAGLEYFKSLTEEKAWRLNWDTSLNVQLIDKFSLAIGSLALYNNDPLPGIRRLDVTSSLSFVYTLL